MMVVRKELDIGLEHLQEMLVTMGQKVGRALTESMEALRTVDAGEARRIIREDLQLNQIDEQISELSARLIATQQPVAKDLRRILAGMKISADLERMGDLSVDIAKVVLRLEGQTLIKPLVDLPLMAEIVVRMIDESIRCYIEENVDLAYKMAKDDDLVDTMFAQIFRELFEIMAGQPKTIGQSMLLCFVARYIERIADHATNIGESVVYLVMGKRPDLNL